MTDPMTGAEALDAAAASGDSAEFGRVVLGIFAALRARDDEEADQ